jgi:hypothetical protein
MAEEALKMQIKSSHNLDPRFIKNLKGKDFVLYSGLLDLGHQIGIQSMNIEAIQFPTKDNGNEAICKAIVTSVDGRVFTEIGDANPKNVNVQIAVHVIRMAATRAKARALRDFTNIGMTCLEELGDIENVIGADESKVIPLRQKNKSQRSTNESPKTENSEKKAEDHHPEKTHEETEAKTSEKNSCARISTAQRSAILNLGKRRGITEEDLFKQIEEMFSVTIDHLSTSEASSYIKTLQNQAA